MCDCEFCIKCDCGHKADEHIAGDGHCFLCRCPRFNKFIETKSKENEDAKPK